MLSGAYLELQPRAGFLGATGQWEMVANLVKGEHENDRSARSLILL
jgi:hypothetical protein